MKDMTPINPVSDRSVSAKENMDGCTAATYVAYALCEVATIYPITPVASMGEIADKWAMQGRRNIFGTTMQVREMESELGAAGATHGALAAGALATTFTNSQGLLMMIPNMYKIAGEQLPAVFHVGSRSLASHALSIFGDHQDVMACRATGFAILCSTSVQETFDLAIAAHLAAIDGSLPVLHFFDGRRTANETATISTLTYDEIASMVDMDKVAAFRKRGLNPEHPLLRGTSQNPDVYFQNREACNPFYDRMPGIMQAAMDRVAAKTGRQYHLADYSGSPEAEHVIVSMGSSCQVVAQTVDWLNANGYKTGGINLHMYRPFPAAQLIDSLPETVKTISVLDRTKEPGSFGEPLYMDVAAAVFESGRNIKVYGGRYGLSSKDFTPAMVKAVFDEAMSGNPKKRFTVGIEDDLTHLSLEVTPEDFIKPADGMVQTIFYGIGADGTVGATKQLTDIVSNLGGGYAQGFYDFSAKKSGGYTISQLRYSDQPINMEYSISEADYLGCNKDTYVKKYDMAGRIREGGIFVLNSRWSDEDLERELPAGVKRIMAAKKIQFYNVDAVSIAQKNGLGTRINMIMAVVFLYLMRDRLPFDKSVSALKDKVRSLYMHEGGDIVNRNISAMDSAVNALHKVDYPASWLESKDKSEYEADVPDFVREIAKPCLRMEGGKLPVSKFAADGHIPMGTSAYEKRRIAVNIPQWDSQKCIHCTQCSMVCAHAAIRPYLLDENEVSGAPAGMSLAETKMPALKGLKYRIQVYPADCLGCASCATICPGHALDMVPIDSIFDKENKFLEYCQSEVTIKDDLVNRDSVIGSQFHQPLLEFSGACAGCGETPYVKLLTQLFGERMIIANATGCSSIWGASYPSNPYCTDRNGRGPAWANSLFEDNAEFGYGIACALESLRQMNKDDSRKPKTCVWAIGGDGWAYDIGFGGLDHVLAQNIDINILVLDTECYSNTGGQTSKATPLSAVMKYSADGKRTYKKDLGRMMMTYPNVYVASVSLGANMNQTIKAFTEAEAHPGPSIVIAYCPCINHGIRSGMSHAIVEEKLAVKTGYWNLYRYNPALDKPLTVDSVDPDGNLINFINGEDRYADLRMIDPKDAAILQPDLEKHCVSVYQILKRMTSCDSKSQSTGK